MSTFWSVSVSLSFDLSMRFSANWDAKAGTENGERGNEKQVTRERKAGDRGQGKEGWGESSGCK
jgi:hypothetical protein